MLTEIRALRVGNSVHFGDAKDCVTVFRNKSGYTMYFGSLKKYACYAEVQRGKFEKAWGSYLPPKDILEKYNKAIELMKRLTARKEVA